MPGKDRSARAAIFITASYAWAAITRNCSHDTRQLFFHLANLTYLTSLGAGLQTSLVIQILSAYFSSKTFQPLSRLLDQGSRAPKSTFHTICTPPRVFLAFTRGRVKWRLVAPELSQIPSTKKKILVFSVFSLFYLKSLKHFDKRPLLFRISYLDRNLEAIVCEKNLKPFSFWKKERLIACPAVNASSTKCISKSPPSLTALSLSQWELITFS